MKNFSTKFVEFKFCFRGITGTISEYIIKGTISEYSIGNYKNQQFEDPT